MDSIPACFDSIFGSGVERASGRVRLMRKLRTERFLLAWGALKE
jgi:hypothetical protein